MPGKKDGIVPVEEAVSGTTLTDIGEGSYVSWMKTINTKIKADAFVCQLSTNDASLGLPLGEMSESMDLEDFDTQTVTGAMEYIIAYAKKTWDCPVVFYTGSGYDSKEYAAMVERLLELQEKWDIGVLDLWNDEEMNHVSQEDYMRFMNDPIHPTLAGYREWWTPKFEDYLIELLTEP